MSFDRRRALIELGDKMVTVSAALPQAWQKAKSQLDNPVALDDFVLKADTAADAIRILAQRTSELAGDVLDGEE